MFFARKRSANAATAEGFVCAKAQRQQQQQQQQQQDVGHEGVITGGDGFSLRSSISLIPKESTSLHSTNIQCIYLKMLSITFSDELSFNIYLLFQI